MDPIDTLDDVPVTASTEVGDMPVVSATDNVPLDNGVGEASPPPDTGPLSFVGGSATLYAVGATPGGSTPQVNDRSGVQHTSAAPAVPASSADSSLVIKVDKPEKRSGINTLGFSTQHMTYEVSTRTCDPKFAECGFTTAVVRRRFNDFAALHKLLRSTLRGCFLPALPDKTLLGVEARLMKDEFIAMRMADLNKYCMSLSAHPDARLSQPLRLFLTVSDELSMSAEWRELMSTNATVLDELKSKLQLGPTASEATPPTSVGTHGTPMTRMAGAAAMLGNKFMKKMKELKVQAKQEVVSTVPELTAVEGELRSTKAQLVEELAAFRTSSQAAENYVHALADMSRATAELGSAFGTLACTEEGCGKACGAYTEAGRSSQQRSADFQKIGYAGLKLTNLYKKYATATAGALMPVQDYFANLPEAIHALEEREHAYLTLKTCEADLAAKKARAPHLATTTLESGTSIPAGSETGLPHYPPGAGTVLDEVAQLTAKLAKARTEYEAILENNKKELERTRSNRASDLDGMLVHFANAQAQLQVALSAQWMNINDQLSME